jgi:hypothetical protein
MNSYIQLTNFIIRDRGEQRKNHLLNQYSLWWPPENVTYKAREGMTWERMGREYSETEANDPLPQTGHSLQFHMG